MTEEVMLHIISCDTAAAMWRKLLSVYEQKSETSIHIVQQRFFQFKFEEGTKKKDNCEPKTYCEAMNSPDACKWQEAIQRELKTLKDNNTWSICDIPDNEKVISSKWVFKIKRNNSNIQYKARLVARGLVYKCDDSNPVGFCDADWGGDLRDRKSTTGYCFMYSNCLISWCSKKQSTVSLSSAESEYVAMSMAGSEACWIANVLCDFNRLDGLLNGPPTGRFCKVPLSTSFSFAFYNGENLIERVGSERRPRFRLPPERVGAETRKIAFGHNVVRSALLKTQRPALMLLTKAYRTIITAALPVLAGVLPAHMEVIIAGRTDCEREGRTAAKVRVFRRRVREEMMKNWDAEMNGRELYRYFPDVSARLSSDWVEPDYQASQLLTGHGCFRKRLHDLGLNETSMCLCEQTDEDMHHVLWSCPLYDDIRSEMLSGIEVLQVGPVYYADLMGTQANFRRLVEYARAWHGLRGGQK
ncbi:Retrovirus-related Pol polyprotein from type-1 retrotransposable element R1 4 [Eumeta japonica]|uniref:Retrovirus-related Pol polyprotein from type-1 retrotransposable element R1 4 n=1 Tax=Eumeta variegata TaxID=151549 RepID=A0A4C1Y7D2_EUMVA|nr:Retrovirus-related Pol polyprotein from type-1 retrotransposable element R1 4 [Eumeta japonica]